MAPNENGANNVDGTKEGSRGADETHAPMQSPHPQPPDEGAVETRQMQDTAATLNQSPNPGVSVWDMQGAHGGAPANRLLAIRSLAATRLLMNVRPRDCVNRLTS